MKKYELIFYIRLLRIAFIPAIKSAFKTADQITLYSALSPAYGEALCAALLTTLWRTLDAAILSSIFPTK